MSGSYNQSLSANYLAKSPSNELFLNRSQHGQTAMKCGIVMSANLHHLRLGCRAEIMSEEVCKLENLLLSGNAASGSRRRRSIGGNSSGEKVAESYTHIWHFLIRSITIAWWL